MGLVEEMRALCEDIVASRFERGEAIKRIKSDTRDMLKRFIADRKRASEEVRSELREFKAARAEMSKALAKELDEYTRGIRKRGADFRKEVRDHISGIKKEIVYLTSDFRVTRGKMHEEWQKMVKPGAEVIVEAKVKEEIEVEEVEMRELKDKVLRIITSSPHGISLTGIGLQLGVEWRKLIRPAKVLLDEGKIRKEEVNYFPVSVAG